MRRRTGLVLASLALVAAGCERAEPRDLVGLWVQPEDPGTLQAQLLLEVDFVAGADGGPCWVARDAVSDGPLLPVRWPAGTLVGMGNMLEVPGGFLVDVGSVVDGGGSLGAVTLPADDAPPRGCDVSAGYHELDSVSEVLVPDEG